MSTQFMFQRVAGGIGTILIGSEAAKHRLANPDAGAPQSLAIAAWGVAFSNRDRIVAAFRQSA